MVPSSAPSQPHASLPGELVLWPSNQVLSNTSTSAGMLWALCQALYSQWRGPQGACHHKEGAWTSLHRNDLLPGIYKVQFICLVFPQAGDLGVLETCVGGGNLGYVGQRCFLALK